MAEDISASHNPDQKFVKAYTEWADGDWGLILTGEKKFQALIELFYFENRRI